MIWGCFCAKGTGNLCFIEDIMTADVYIDILNTSLVESVIGLEIRRDFIFQQDNDPKQAAKKTMKFFEENMIKVLE